MAWMRVTPMPSDHTRNHVWCVAHQISLHSQQTDRCKCGGRITLDHVHFECRFVKPLWAIFTQANGLSVNSFIPQTQRTFLEGTLFQPRFRRKKGYMVRHDTQCCVLSGMGEMAALQRHHPQSHPPSERLAQCPHLAAHINTKKLVELARTHWL